MYKPAVFALALLATACRSTPDRGLVAHGTVEVREVDASPLVPARLLRVSADEGAAVRRGDTLAILTRSSLLPQVERERARLDAARATLADLELGARSEEIRAAEATLSGAEADLERSLRDLKRVRTLAANGATSQQALDAAETASTIAKSRRDAAAEELELRRKGTRPEQVRRARAELASARAALAAAEADLGDMVLLATEDGIVLDRYAEPGEVLGAGEPVLTVGATHEPWVRAWLPQRTVASLRVGQPAMVSLDGATGEYPGTISVISSRAEFTPRAALTEEERADLMFAIRVDVLDTTGHVKPGLSATVRFGAP